MNSENKNEIESLDLDFNETNNQASTPVNPVSEPNSVPVNNMVNEVVEEPVIDANGDSNVEKTQVMPNLQSMTNLEPEETSNISYDTKDAYNEFADKKPRKKQSPLIIVLMVVLILGAALAGYYVFFLKGNKGTTGGVTGSVITTKEVVIELGDPIPTNITTYINKDLKQTEYKLYTSGIKNNEIGEYEYKVTYNGQSYSGKAIVKDTVAPKLEVKNITAKSISDVNVELFVTSCTDASECSYSIKNDALTNVTSDGTYDITIIATDSQGNETEKDVTLTINGNFVTNFLTCTKPYESTKSNALINYTTTINFDEKNIIKELVEEKKYTFNTSTDYNNFKTNNPDELGTYNVKDYTYYAKAIYSKDSLSKDESRKVIPTEKTKTKAFYESNGYNCK